MKRMSRQRFYQIVSQFSQKKMIVLGDVMLDEWVWGKVNRISPEAPVPVVEVNYRSFTAGGASNVATNLRSLGAEVTVLGVIGKDQPGKVLLKELALRDIDTSGLLAVADRPTTLKTRIIAHNQQVVRADLEETRKLEKGATRKLVNLLRQVCEDAHALIVSDYNKGVITKDLLAEALSIARKRSILIVAGPKPANIFLFHGVELVALNQTEASRVTGMNISDEDILCRVGEWFFDNLHCKAVLITRGEAGMSLFESGGHISHIPAVASEVYDVSGAGDTVLGLLSLALVCGANYNEAAELSNYAAGVVVRKVGTATIAVEELEQFYNERKDKVSTSAGRAYSKVKKGK